MKYSNLIGLPREELSLAANIVIPSQIYDWKLTREIELDDEDGLAMQEYLQKEQDAVEKEALSMIQEAQPRLSKFLAESYRLEKSRQNIIRLTLMFSR